MMENVEGNAAYFAAVADWLVNKLSGPLKATRELQDKEKQRQPDPPCLEDAVLKSLTSGGTVFLKQKHLFAMLPGLVQATILNDCDVKWRQLPLVNQMVNDRTVHLALYLTKPSYAYDKNGGKDGEGWTLQEVDRLCRKIAQESKNSLQSLDITAKPYWLAWREKHEAEEARTSGESDPTAPQSPTPGGPDERPPESHPGVTAAQLCALLQEVRGLVNFHLKGYFEEQEILSIVSTLADTNPGIRYLLLPTLSGTVFTKIAESWPELEMLGSNVHNSDSSELAELPTALLRLKNLRQLRVRFHHQKAQAMIYVAHHHDPSTPPYKLTDGYFDCAAPEVGSEMVGKLLDTFPAVTELRLTRKEVPVVCAELQGRSHISITRLKFNITETHNEPRVLEPLLALIGKNLTELEVETWMWSRIYGSVDVGMIGHYCPNLQDLRLSASQFVAGNQYKVTPSFFSKLKILSLRRASVAGSIYLPDPLVFRVLVSPHLKEIKRFDVVISEEVMASVAAESGEQRALSSLEDAFVSPWSASVEELAVLLSHAPRLQELWVPCSPEEDEELGVAGVLTAFVQRSGLSVKLITDE